MCTVYYAKSPDKSGHQTTNKMHLEAAAELARTFGTEINMPLTAWISGWLHDFGKYSRSFQNVLNGTASNIDHAICAAVYLYGKILQKRPRPAYEAVAAVTAAHHSALRSYASMRPELSELFNGTGRGICGSGKQSALLGPADYTAAERAFYRIFPASHSKSWSSIRTIPPAKRCFACACSSPAWWMRITPCPPTSHPRQAEH